MKHGPARRLSPAEVLVLLAAIAAELRDVELDLAPGRDLEILLREPDLRRAVRRSDPGAA